MRTIAIFEKEYAEHRLAWLWMTGSFPPGPLDHENRDATDNRWKNLRLSTPLENMRNRSMQSNNSSGVNGVTWFSRTRKWRAEIKVKGEHKHLGYFADLEDAKAAREEAELLFGFSSGHGKPPGGPG